MMVLQTPLPPNLRKGLTTFSGSLFINNKTGDCGVAQLYNPGHEVVSSLPLQMMLYFHAFYFPFWCLSEGVMLELKFSLLPGYYQFLLVAAYLTLILVESLRLYLGYIGNLQEKRGICLFHCCCTRVNMFIELSATTSISLSWFITRNQVPELAGFLLLSVLIELPVLLFILTDQHSIQLPLETAVHLILLLFLTSEIAATFFALKVMTKQLAMQFYRKQFEEDLERPGQLGEGKRGHWGGEPSWRSQLPISLELAPLSAQTC